ncbi:hypothetical protein [Pilimelia columellifera]|uniref:Hedgehog n=1 Tax=Pilimelia columellifera subsp. columellifera TaxID=706583 RepID=A0ABN3NAP3_9ACTN
MAARTARPLPRSTCLPADLRIGDEVLTPSRQWERVTDLLAGDRFTRSTQVITAESGPGFPWLLTAGHLVIVRRPVSVPAQRAA